MTKECKQVLKILNKLSKSSEEILFLDYGYVTICANSGGSLPLNDLSNEITGILRMLVDDGYIIYYIPSNFPDGEFSLTHKGLHWRQLMLKSLVLYIIKSIIVPVVVSIVTTIVTIKLTSLMG